LTARLRLRFARYFPRRTSSGAGCSRLYFTNLSLLQPQHSSLLMKRFPHRSGCLGQIFPRCCRAVRAGVVTMRHSTTTRGPCQWLWHPGQPGSMVRRRIAWARALRRSICRASRRAYVHPGRDAFARVHDPRTPEQSGPDPPSSRLFSILPVRVLLMFCLSRSPVLII